MLLYLCKSSRIAVHIAGSSASRELKPTCGDPRRLGFIRSFNLVGSGTVFDLLRVFLIRCLLLKSVWLDFFLESLEVLELLFYLLLLLGERLLI